MRRPGWMIPSIAVLVMGALSAPAQAQTYDPHYPVCLQTYGIDGSSISVPIWVDGRVPGVGVGPRGAMHRQPLLRTGGFAAPVSRLLTPA